MKDWIKINDVDFFDETILQYHIDTRDFCCLCNKEKRDDELDLHKIDKLKERFYHTSEEIISLIERYKKESGGDGSWRFFNLKGADNWSMKYIRIFRNENGLLVCDSNSKVLNKEFLSQNIERKHLNKI